jgi:uncharacterized membrane protein YuzA (DUF378 family)
MMKSFYVVALVLSIIGAINWGLVGLFQVDLVALLFGPASVLSRIVYVIVGLGGIALAWSAIAMAELREMFPHATH